MNLESFRGGAGSVVNSGSRNQINGGSTDATEPSHTRKRHGGAHKRSKSQGKTIAELSIFIVHQS